MRCMISFVALLFMLVISADAGDILIGDFEQDGFGTWRVSGDAFGPGPARAVLSGQPWVSGFLGGKFISSGLGGSQATGVLISPPFVVERDYINFLIGGGYHLGKRETKQPRDFWGDECIVTLLADPDELMYDFGTLNAYLQNLAVEKKVALRTTTGPGISPRGDVKMEWATWDVRSLKGKTIQIRIVDNNRAPDGFICIDQMIQSDRPRKDLLHNADILRRANRNVQRVEKTAAPRRGYHYKPAVFGFGGPTCVYHDGYYHLFWIYDPFWDPAKVVYPHKFWRHARSKDLVHWEDLPVAIWPSEDNGEHYCAAGAAVIDDNGVPRIFYTSRSSERQMDQMTAVGDADLLNWRKIETNPIITETPANPMTHETDGSVFKHEDRWYMALGGKRKVGDEYRGCFSLHVSDDLVEWEFVSIPYTAETSGWEEPEMFQLGDKWVVVFEPFGPTQYFTGAFDWENHTFHPEVHGFLDFVGSEKHIPKVHGHAEYTGQFYGCTPFRDKDGRMIYLGMAPGGSSLPRVISLRPDGKLAQQPIEALSALRGEHVTASNLELMDESRLFDEMRENMLEIKVEFIPGSAEVFGLRVCRSDDGTRFTPITCDGKRLVVDGEKIPADLLEGESSLRLHIFIDRHIMEVFANDWVVYTKGFSAPAEDSGIELFSAGGATRVKNLEIWKMNSIW